MKLEYVGPDEQVRRVRCPGLVTSECRGPIMEFIECGPNRDYLSYRISFPVIPKPDLPAVLRRVCSADDFGQPATFLSQTGQLHCASTAELREVCGAAPVEASIEQRTLEAAAESVVTKALESTEARNVLEYFFGHVPTVSPSEFARLLNQKLPPKTIAPQFQPEYSERKESHHDYSI